MSNNIFIIGNGFDLDLGLPTKFSDFANSNYWPLAKKKEKNQEISTRTSRGGFNTIPPLYHTILLEHYLENKRDKESWFDLEQYLLDYASPNVSKKVVDPSQELESKIQENIVYYNKVQNSLYDYILSIQGNKTIKTNSIAGKVLHSIVENGFFDHICSFNYTDLNLIANQLGISKTLNYYHIHGSVANNSIILGVDETKLRKGYESFHKTSSKHYPSHNLYTELDKASEIVFFGLSFGKIDYSYFDHLFKKIASEERIPEAKKKYITIFTKDDNSRQGIITNLRDMDINIQRLYAQSHFQIICTADGIDNPPLKIFMERLHKNGINAHNNNMRNLASRVY